MARQEETQPGPRLDLAEHLEADIVRPGRRELTHGAIRLVLGLSVVGVLMWLYSIVPMPERVDTPGGYFIVAVIALVAYLALTAWGVSRLRTARYPAADGMVLVVVMAAIVILGYAYAYQTVEVQDPASFSEPLTRAAAVYFTVTVLTTVGFGDITPVTDTARLVVTSQMVVGLTVISLSLKLIVQSTRTAKATKTAQALARRHAADAQSSPGGSAASG